MKIPSEEDKPVFEYLRELFAFAEEKGIRFPGRSPMAALTFMNNIERGQWLAKIFLGLWNKGFKAFPLPTPEVCETLGLQELAASLRAEREE